MRECVLGGVVLGLFRGPYKRVIISEVTIIAVRTPPPAFRTPPLDMPRLASPLRAHIIIGDTHTICQYCGWTARTNFSRVGDHFARIRGRYAPQCNNVPFDIWVLANTLVRHPPAGEPLPHWNLGEPEPEPEPQHQVNVNALWIQNVQAEIDRLTTARLNLIILLVAANGNGFVVLPNNLAYVAGNLVEIIEQLEETRNVLQQGTM